MLVDEKGNETYIVQEVESNNEKEYAMVTLSTGLMGRESDKNHNEKEVWIADSGASSHMCSSHVGLTDLVPYTGSVIIRDRRELKITHQGTLRL